MTQQYSYRPSSRPSSRSRSKGPRFRKISLFIVFFIAIILVVVLLSKILKREIVFTPGTLSLGESLTENEKIRINDILDNIRLPYDLTIVGENRTSIDSQLADNNAGEKKDTLLFDILIPVTGFYNAEMDISADVAKNAKIIAHTKIDPNDENIYLVSLSELTPDMKALSIDGKYYLEEIFNDASEGEQYGAVFRILKFDSENTEVAFDAIKKDVKLQGKDDILYVNQTGVTALTRAMLNKLGQVGDGAFFAEKIADYLKKSDVTHISNEISFANDCRNSSSTALCSDPRMFDTILAIGTDVVELTGNHNNDWGAENNIATIEKYRNNGLSTFGGGLNEEDAKAPYQYNGKDTTITWIGVNESTSTKANGQGASGDHPGANIFDEQTLRSQIKAAKENGDFVIVDVQYFECYSYPDYGEEMPECDRPISGQKDFFRSIIDMGADMVVGTQAHQPQTFEIYNGKFIYYGTGNLFFDQIYWPGTTRSIIFSHYFHNGKLIQTRLVPTFYDSSFQTQIMDTNSAKQFIDRLIKSSDKGE